MDESCHKLKHEPGVRCGNLEAVEVVVEGTPVGQRRRGCAAGDHVLWEPVEGGTDGLRRKSGEQGTNRERRDGGGLGGDRQTTALRLGDEMERVWGGGGAEPAVLNPYDGRWDQFWAKIDRWCFWWRRNT